MNKDYANRILKLIDKSPTAFHVVENAKSILDAEGFTGLAEAEVWKLKAGGKYYVTRNDSSIIAFTIPGKDYKGFRIIAGHSDSPCPKLKENCELDKNGYIRLNVEKYGGMILAPWFDRPLSVAGRILVRDENEASGIRSVLVNLDKNVAVIPSLAIHMNRDVNSGYSYSFQKDMLPIVSTSGSSDKTIGSSEKEICSSEKAICSSEKEFRNSIMSLIAEASGVNVDSILGNDLFLYIREEGKIWGINDEFIGSSRLDDQECVWCTLDGFIDSIKEASDYSDENSEEIYDEISGAISNKNSDEASNVTSEYIKMLCIFDNEEVGSRTKQGADSNFLENLISRINDNLGRSREDYYTAYASSFMISADNAHALHPAHTDKYDPVQSPKINEGIVLKFSARQSYTTDAVSAAFVKKLCKDAGIPYQIFVNHSDEPGGSTLGNISNSHVSINTADIGLPQLAMHSAYETAGVEDLDSLRIFAETFFTDSI
ncbi:MAG: M18 family aminopeptidase [Eubacterium sp.]|nr:M18 family aminopeptidase [Eubacterium sp.]